MMRPIIHQVPPAAPTTLAAVSGTPGQVLLTWADNSANEDSYTLQRDITTAFSAPTLFAVNSGNSTGFNTKGYGGTVTFTDNTAAGGPFYYRVQANDSFT